MRCPSFHREEELSASPIVYFSVELIANVRVISVKLTLFYCCIEIQCCMCKCRIIYARLIVMEKHKMKNQTRKKRRELFPQDLIRTVFDISSIIPFNTLWRNYHSTPVPLVFFGGHRVHSFVQFNGFQMCQVVTTRLYAWMFHQTSFNWFHQTVIPLRLSHRRIEFFVICVNSRFYQLHTLQFFSTFERKIVFF